VGDRWALACDPGEVTIAQVYARLVFAGSGSWDAGDPMLDGVMERAASGAGRAINAPLRTLMQDEKASPPKRTGRQEDPAPRTVENAVDG
jgi:hypothetical protein